MPSILYQNASRCLSHACSTKLSLPQHKSGRLAHKKAFHWQLHWLTAPGCHIWLPLCCEDDTGVGVVETVLCKPHEGRILLHQQDEQCITLNAVHLQNYEDVMPFAESAKQCAAVYTIRAAGYVHLHVDQLSSQRLQMMCREGKVSTWCQQHAHTISIC